MNGYGTSNFICNVSFIFHTQTHRNCKNYVNHIKKFSVHANVCAQKSLERTCPGFDPIPPLS